MSAKTSSSTADQENCDARDFRLLARLADAQLRGGELSALRARVTIGDLLAPYWDTTRRLAAWRLATISPQDTDLDEIAGSVFERMVKTLMTKTSFGGVPFRVVVAKNAHWEAIEFWRRRRRDLARETLHDHETLPEIETVDDSALVHAEVVAEIIEELAPRDQRILVERYVLGMNPEQIAEGMDVHRRVVDTACSRALAKLRGSPRVAAVRDRLKDSV
jgi:RNA polymerase sigma factor (sigma-70 family)